MRQRNHCGHSFAVSVAEEPHPQQCRLIFPPGGLSGIPTSEYRRCLCYRSELQTAEFCAAHMTLELIVAEVSHPQCDVGVHAWDQLDYPTAARCKRCGRLAGELEDSKPQVCCELYVDTGHHEPDCREFFHMMSEP